MKILQNKNTRVLIIAMSTLVVLALLIARWYYSSENKSIDPRVVIAHQLYERYNSLAENSDYEEIFLLMDSIEDIYSEVDHYRKSYEVGVIYNNRAAAYIAMALDSTLSDTLLRDSLFQLAEYNVQTSIDIYSEWIDTWGNKSKEEISQMLIPFFPADDPVFKGQDINRFIRKRTRQIIEAQYETPRRLSVSYTNLGIIYRHRQEYDNAAKQYFIALDLWPDNLAAENNLNVLLGQEQKKQGIIRKLFPKDRIKD